MWLFKYFSVFSRVCRLFHVFSDQRGLHLTNLTSLHPVTVSFPWKTPRLLRGFTCIHIQGMCRLFEQVEIVFQYHPINYGCPGELDVSCQSSARLLKSQDTKQSYENRAKEPDRWRCVSPILICRHYSEPCFKPQVLYMLRETHKATRLCTLACKGLPLQH